MKNVTWLVIVLPALLTGCPRQKEESEPLTLGEASQALEESTLSTQAEGLASASVDISTNFTLGQAVRQSAEELSAFIQSQLPCANVSLVETTLTIEYGVNDGSCLYRGHTFSGKSSVTVTRNDSNQVIVDHVWTNLSNGVVKLNGTAHVTWDFDAKSRHIVHDTEWTSLRTGKTGKGSGDRTQTLLEGGLSEGIRVDGSRSWTGPRGQWDLGIDGVEMRWADPIPQAGSYTLSTPFKKTISMSFTRVDVDTIRVTVTGPKRSFNFTVSKSGDATSESS